MAKRAVQEKTVSSKEAIYKDENIPADQSRIEKKTNGPLKILNYLVLL